jgi:hypothetical protein
VLVHVQELEKAKKRSKQPGGRSWRERARQRASWPAWSVPSGQGKAHEAAAGCGPAGRAVAQWCSMSQLMYKRGIREEFSEKKRQGIENLAAIEQTRPGFWLFVKDDLRDFSEVLCTHNLDD